VLVLAAVALALTIVDTAILSGCYRCDSPGEPRCPAVQPDYPPPAPMGAPRDAGRE